MVVVSVIDFEEASILASPSVCSIPGWAPFRLLWICTRSAPSHALVNTMLGVESSPFCLLYVLHKIAAIKPVSHSAFPWLPCATQSTQDYDHIIECLMVLGRSTKVSPWSFDCVLVRLSLCCFSRPRKSSASVWPRTHSPSTTACSAMRCEVCTLSTCDWEPPCAQSRMNLSWFGIRAIDVLSSRALWTIPICFSVLAEQTKHSTKRHGRCRTKSTRALNALSASSRWTDRRCEPAIYWVPERLWLGYFWMGSTAFLN